MLLLLLELISFGQRFWKHITFVVYQQIGILNASVGFLPFFRRFFPSVYVDKIARVLGVSAVTYRRNIVIIVGSLLFAQDGCRSLRSAVVKAVVHVDVGSMSVGLSLLAVDLTVTAASMVVIWRHLLVTVNTGLIEWFISVRLSRHSVHTWSYVGGEIVGQWKPVSGNVVGMVVVRHVAVVNGVVDSGRRAHSHRSAVVRSGRDCGIIEGRLIDRMPLHAGGQIVHGCGRILIMVQRFRMGYYSERRRWVGWHHRGLIRGVRSMGLGWRGR